MKTITALAIVALGFSFTSNLVQAAPRIISGGDQTIYQQVLNYFNEGAAPDQARVTGVYSGRCYTPAAPNTPLAGIVIGASYPTSGDNGPLFPAQSVFKILRAPSLDTNVAANSYDTMTSDLQATITSITNDAQSANDTAAQVVNGSLVTVNTSGDLAYTVRVYQDYLFSSDTIVTTNGTYKAGDVYTACYFFNKLN